MKETPQRAQWCYGQHYGLNPVIRVHILVEHRPFNKVLWILKVTFSKCWFRPTKRFNGLLIERRIKSSYSKLEPADFWHLCIKKCRKWWIKIVVEITIRLANWLSDRLINYSLLLYAVIELKWMDFTAKFHHFKCESNWRTYDKMSQIF